MIVYLIRNIINGKGYVGQTTNSLKIRWRHHCSNARLGSNFLLHKAIRKYGEGSFELSTLVTTDNLPDLNLQEVDQIIKQGTMSPNGYNLQTGGGNYTVSVVTRKRLSDSHKGKVLPPAQRVKMSAAHTGDRNSFFGKKHSIASRVKMRVARLRFLGKTTVE